MNRETPPWIWTLLLALAVALPLVLHARGQDFYISMLSRMMIYGIAACSLNLMAMRHLLALAHTPLAS
jgi:branched-chain amino acid transport system permease protein